MLLLLKENAARLPQATGFTLRLEEGEDVVLPDWALDVTDDGAGRVVHELDADLGDTTTGSGPAEDLDDLCELDLGLGGVHIEKVGRGWVVLSW